MRTECCLFSSALFKSIFNASISYPKYELDFARDDADHLNADYLIPGVLFNSDMHRFDIRYVISALNYICIELLNGGFYLNVWQVYASVS